MKTRSPATATPRLALPPWTPLVGGRLYCQIWRPRAGVERVALVRSRHVHDSAGHDGRDLQRPASGIENDPLRRQPRDVRLVDLRQRRVAVPAGIAVVGGPLGLGRDFPEEVAHAPQQVHPLVGGQELQVGETLAAHLALQRAAVRRLNRPALDRRDFPLDRAQEAQQAGHLRRGEARCPACPSADAPRGSASPSSGSSRADRRHRDRRPPLATVAAGAVAKRAALLEDLAAGLQALRAERRATSSPDDRRRRDTAVAANRVGTR